MTRLATPRLRTTLPLNSLLLACTLALAPSTVEAQQPTGTGAATGAVRVRPSGVYRVILLRTNPGMGREANADVLDHLVPLYEEYKKAGLLTRYEFVTNMTSDGPNDWDFGIILYYPNMGVLENLAERTDPITLRHYGSVAARQAANDRRAQLRTVVSNRLTRPVTLSR